MLSASSGHIRYAGRRVVSRRGIITASRGAASSSSVYWMSAAALTVTVAAVAIQEPQRTSLLSRVPTGGDILMVGAPVKEKATGIMFPQLCNGYSLVGCGVRVKWGLIKVVLSWSMLYRTHCSSSLTLTSLTVGICCWYLCGSHRHGRDKDTACGSDSKSIVESLVSENHPHCHEPRLVD